MTTLSSKTEMEAESDPQRGLRSDERQTGVTKKGGKKRTEESGERSHKTERKERRGGLRGAFKRSKRDDGWREWRRKKVTES